MSGPNDEHGADAGPGRTVRGACPLDCPDACSWDVTVSEGRAVRLRGARDHPFTRGGLCNKVTSYLDHTAAPDRLLQPLRRVGPKGEGRFEPVSWDAALDEIAQRWRAVIDRSGAEAIWPFLGTGTVGFLQGVAGTGKRLFNHLGTSQHVADICAVAGHVGVSYTMGSGAGMDPEDLAHSGVVLLWGTNTLTTNAHLWPFIRDARGRGSHVVAIDPVRTRTARRVDEHVALRPGTDGALALGLIARIVACGGEDARFLADATLGWDELRARALEWTPGRVAEVCGIPAAQVERLGERLAADGPVGIRFSMGMQRHAGGGNAARLISAIPAVTGDHRRLGGGACYSTSPAYPLNQWKLHGRDLATGSPRRLMMSRLAEGLLELDDPPIEALLVVAANPVVSNPDQERVRAGLARNDLFTVVVEHFLTDTADYADIVLPSTMQTEHADLHDSFSHLYLQWNEPAVEPPGECLPHTEIWRRLARALGCDEPAVYASDHDLARAALDTDDPALAGVTLERLRAHGWVRLSVPRPYLPFADRFPTASGRFEFVSDRAEHDGLGRVPDYTPPAEAVPGPRGGAGSGERTSGPGRTLSLLAPADHDRLNSLFANRELHERRAGADVVHLHPDDAAALGVSDGDEVCLGNARGSFTVRASVDDVARPGVAVTTKGRWPKLEGGPTVNATTGERSTDAGGPTFHDNRVTVRVVTAANGTTTPSADDGSDNGDRSAVPVRSPGGAGNLDP
ncbi:MAG: molybdopterin-dependent oxidoreductase [Actinomycetota bacterium]|nr:molybdopterin-dependent oxidoreductase [Actinomycetota bacterium]